MSLSSYVFFPELITLIFAPVCRVNHNRIRMFLPRIYYAGKSVIRIIYSIPVYM